MDNYTTNCIHYQVCQRSGCHTKCQYFEEKPKLTGDLISRSALKEAMWDESHSIVTFTECGTEEARFGLTSSEIEQIIDNAQPVERDFYITGAQWDEFMKEYKRPHGEWITKEHSIEYYCSQCGERLDQCCEDFCCRCGADMRGISE